MPDFLQRESNRITIANFYEGYELEKYNFEPPYQRRSLWTEEKKSFLIDSILKNYPIPPIFLHQKIDDETGKTIYDVIDGKQRLTAIIEFIENQLPVADENGELSGSNLLAGRFFHELEGDELSIYKSRFWRYVIPIEYVDTGEQEVIDSIFDRLNRNGEPLKGQELRNANYYGTPLLNLLETLSSDAFWRNRLSKVDRSRMEEVEFLSELAFLELENGELHANQDELDKLYEKYAGCKNVDCNQLNKKLLEVTRYMESLELNYDEIKIGGVSHLYGLFSLSRECIENHINVEVLKPRLYEFFDLWQSKDYSNDHIKNYKESMSSRTKNRGQRRKRREALVGYCLQ